jgi:hypothetical protein
LCEEFAVKEIAEKLSEFCPSRDCKEPKEADARRRITLPEEKANQHSRFIAMLHDKVTQLPADFGCFVGEVSAGRSPAAEIQTLWKEVSAVKTQIGHKLIDHAVGQRSVEFRDLHKEVLTHKAEITVMSLTVTPSQAYPCLDHLTIEFRSDQEPIP